MCVKSCLCNSCYKKNTCSDCEYIENQKEVDCYIEGVTKCPNKKDRGGCYNVDF